MSSPQKTLKVVAQSPVLAAHPVRKLGCPESTQATCLESVAYHTAGQP